MRTLDRASDRAVYLSGQLGSQHSADAVGAALEVHGYTVIDCLTFAATIDNLAQVILAAKGADVFSHSSGGIVSAEAALEASASHAPTAMHLIAPPTPTSVPRLIYRAGRKTVIPGDTGNPDEKVASGMWPVVKEAFRHPGGNFVPVFNGRISRFNACRAAKDVRLKHGGTVVNLAFMSNDGFGFQPTALDVKTAELSGARVVQVDGVHDQLPMFPYTTLSRYSEVLARAT